jgi:hypothetical protein
LIVNRALSQTQITWGDLIEADRPLQMEQPELHHENPPQGIEAAQEGGDSTQMEVPLPQPEIETAREGRDNTQMEVPLPQPEIEADPIQLAETQTSQAETSKKKRKRTIVVPKTPTEKRRRSKRIAQSEETQEIYRQNNPHRKIFRKLNRQNKPHKKILRKIPNHHLKSLQNSSSKVMR